MEQIDWNKWLTIIAALALISAILIPLIQKKYEERKSKKSFKMYLKKYFGIINNILTYDKIEYTIPSIKDNLEKSSLTFIDYVKTFENDFNGNHNTVQTRIAFTLIFNLQNLLFVIHRIQLSIKQIDVSRLYEQTLAYGNDLTNKELNKIYGILLLLENFTSITSFHDRFGTMKSIKRDLEKGLWTGLSIDQSLLKNQQIVQEDLLKLNNNELSINEIIKISRLLTQELTGFYDLKNRPKKSK
jgi:hypothetical protein